METSKRKEKTLTTKKTNDGGGPAAIDLPIDMSEWIPESEAVLDLTGSIVRKPETGEAGAGGEQPWQRVLREGDAKKADLSEEDAVYEAFLEQSGMNDLLGRPASAAERGEAEATNMSAAGGSASETRPAGSFFGAEEFLRLAAEDAADLSGGGTAEFREQEEADELNDALRRQSHEEHFGEQPQVSDDEMWSAYQSALGQGS